MRTVWAGVVIIIILIILLGQAVACQPIPPAVSTPAMAPPAALSPTPPPATLSPATVPPAAFSPTPPSVSPSPTPVSLADVPPQRGFPRPVAGPVWFSSPAVADVDGDGELEVLVGDGEGQVWAWHHDGQPVDGFPLETGDGRIDGPLAVGDVDGDGRPEIVAGTRQRPGTHSGRVFVWHGDGRLLPGWPQAVAWNPVDSEVETAEVSAVALADLDGDGRREVLAGTTNEAAAYVGDDPPTIPNLYAWRYDGQLLSPAWPIGYRTAGIFGELAAGDLDGDGRAEVVTGRDQLYLHAYRADGQPLPGWPVRCYLDTRYRRWDVDPYVEFTRAAPTLADLDGDGRREVVVVGRVRRPPDHQSMYHALLVLDAAGRRRPGWEYPPLGGAPLGRKYLPHQAPVVVDLDGDGEMEIVFTAYDGFVYAYRAGGRLYWRADYARGHVLFASEPAVGDVDGDGDPEIVFGTYDPALGAAPVGVQALHHDGRPVDGFPWAVGAPGVRAAPTLADLDGDGDVEIVAGGLDGHLYVWDLPSPWNPERVPWPTGRLNEQRTACCP